MSDEIQDTFQFGRQFRLKLLLLMLDNSWMARYGEIIKPEYFEQDDETAFANAVSVYRQKFSKSPRDPDDVVELIDKAHVNFAFSIYDMEDVDLSLAQEFAVTFAKEQATKLAILDSVDDVMSGNLAVAVDRMKQALQVGEDLSSPGIDPVRDIDKWLYDYWTDKVRTGMHHIDRILEGGLSGGELGILMSPQNRGKSMSLINVGYGAASIGSGKNVLHLSHEMRTSQVARRYAARMVFRFPQPGDNLRDYADDLINAARKLLVGRIKIIDGKKSTAQIESHIERLISDDFQPGLIIDDYLDYVVPPQKYSDRRFELSAIYDWFRNDLCYKYKIPGWSASQVRRAAATKEIITLEEVAEDIGKASIADVIVTICQTREEEELNVCRLFMAKVRDSSHHATFHAKYYGEQQAIITTGIVKPKSREQNV